MDGGTGEKAEPRRRHAVRLADYPFSDAKRRSDDPARPDPMAGMLETTRDQVDACVDIATRAGLDFLVLNQTRPDIEVPIVRVIVPGCGAFYRRFAPGRLTIFRSNSDCGIDRCRKAKLTPFLPHS